MGIVIEKPKDPAAIDALGQELADRAWEVIEAWDDPEAREDELMEDVVRELDRARTAYLEAIEPKVATRPPQDPSAEA